MPVEGIVRKIRGACFTEGIGVDQVTIRLVTLPELLERLDQNPLIFIVYHDENQEALVNILVGVLGALNIVFDEAVARAEVGAYLCAFRYV